MCAASHEPKRSRAAVVGEVHQSMSSSLLTAGWYPLLVPTRDLGAPPLRSGTAKAPRLRGFHEERMKGLEPSTFCMASRRSSQLSYIRARSA